MSIWICVQLIFVGTTELFIIPVQMYFFYVFDICFGKQSAVFFIKWRDKWHISLCPALLIFNYINNLKLVTNNTGTHVICLY